MSKQKHVIENKVHVLCLYNYIEHCRIHGQPRNRFPVVSLDFSVTYFLPTVPWPWGRLSP